MIRNIIDIWLDVDDTIVQTDKRSVEFLNGMYHKQCNVEDVYNQGYDDLYEGLTVDVVKNMFEDDLYYKNIEWHDGAKDVVHGIMNKYKINICTVGTQKNLANKYNWILDNIKGDINIFGILHEFKDVNKSTKKMYDMKGAIQIDDDVSKLIDTNASVKILFRGNRNIQRNQVPENCNFYVVNTWEEIDEILKFIYDNQEEFMKGL